MSSYSWPPSTGSGGGGGGGTPSPPANSVQYNNAGTFGGASNFTFDGSNLVVPTTTVSTNGLSTLNISNVSAISAGGGVINFLSSFASSSGPISASMIGQPDSTSGGRIILRTLSTVGVLTDRLKIIASGSAFFTGIVNVNTPGLVDPPGTNVVFSVNNGHIGMFQTSPPTGVINANAGVGASVVVTGNDQSGTILLTTGGSGQVAGIIMNLVYARPYHTNGRVVLYPSNAVAAQQAVANQVFVDILSTGFTVNFAVVDNVARIYRWCFHVLA